MPTSFRGNGQPIGDGDTTPRREDFSDFGETNVGTPVDHAFYIINAPDSCNLSGWTFPAGFAAVGTPPITASPNSGDVFTVRLTADSAGTYAGDVSVTSSDGADANPLTFRITGVVNPLPVAGDNRHSSGGRGRRVAME